MAQVGAVGVVGATVAAQMSVYYLHEDVSNRLLITEITWSQLFCVSGVRPVRGRRNGRGEEEGRRRPWNAII